MHVLRVQALLALVCWFPCLELCNAMHCNSCKLGMLRGFCSPPCCCSKNALCRVFAHLVNAHILFSSTGTRRLALLTGIVLCHLYLFLVYSMLSLPHLGECPWFPPYICSVAIKVSLVSFRCLSCVPQCPWFSACTVTLMPKGHPIRSKLNLMSLPDIWPHQI
jgi:hypothetical protein